MKILIVMPTKALKEVCIVEALAYLPRLRPPLQATALFTNPKSLFTEQRRLERIEAEGLELLQKTEGYFRIALGDNGRTYSSELFAAYLEKQALSQPKVAFIIGGAFGLSSQVLEKCQAQLSLSAMTLPHRLAFLILCEQLFRASEIIRGTAYHK
jgi:23S rRNA (pseudouridine1915-N3)-methyltransferase